MGAADVLRLCDVRVCGVSGHFFEVGASDYAAAMTRDVLSFLKDGRTKGA